MQFDQMRRVQIANPQIADVVVSSTMQLALYAKMRGVTTLYVWDNTGLHEYEVTVTGMTPAEQVAAELQRALGDALIYTTVGEDALIVEGSVSNRDRLDRAHRIVAARQSPQFTIVDMVTLQGVSTDKAQAAADAIKDLFGQQIECKVIGPGQLVVQGDLNDPKLVEQVGLVLQATAGTEVSVLNLVQYNDDLASPPIDKIVAAVGPDLKVWQVKGRTVAVDGKVGEQTEYERLQHILESFADRANIINLVRVIPPRPPIDEYGKQLAAAFGPDVEVRVMGSDTLALEGNVTSEEKAEHYKKILEAMDTPYNVQYLMHVVEPYRDQIEVAVLVAELSKSDMDKLGLEWGQFVPPDDDGLRGFLSQPFKTTVEADEFSGSAGNIYTLGAEIDALLENGNSRVLSRPKIMVNDGSEAEILVGGEVPIPIVQPEATGITTITVEYKHYGVTLKLTPLIKTDGKNIDLALAPEVSSLDWANGVKISGFEIPALRTRRATTAVTVPNGGTLVLGGLLQREDSETISKVPFLAEIPIIGDLFKHKSFTSGDTELVFFVTPRIATGEAHPDGYKHPLDQELQQMRQIEE